MKVRSLALTGAAALVMAIGCGPVEEDDVRKGGLGQACHADDTCDGLLVCIDGECIVEDDEIERGRLGEACYPNHACDHPLICAYEVCVERPLDEGGAGQPCYADGTCEGPLYCSGGECVAEGEPGELGGPCLEGDECESPNVCVEGVCECAEPGTMCSDGTIHAGNYAGYDYFTTPADLGWRFTWNNGGTDYTDTGVFDEDDGWTNTSILADLDDAGAPYKAAKACWELDAHGHSDWFLPAKNELMDLLYENRRAIGGFDSNGTYWSSSSYEGDVGAAWFVTFDYGTAIRTGKDFNTRVRCVRGSG